MTMTETQWDTFENVEQIGRLVVCQAIAKRDGMQWKQRWVVVLPEGIRANVQYVAHSSGQDFYPFHPDGVVVYGPVDKRGIDRAHAWRHDGPWVADLEKIANTRLIAERDRMFMQKRLEEEKQEEVRARERTLLATYTPYMKG